MNKNTLKSLLSIICLIAFINIVTIILPVFSIGKTDAFTSIENLFGYQLIAKLINGSLKDTAMIIFAVVYVVSLILSLFLIINCLANIKRENYTGKSVISYSIFTFLFVLVFCVFVSVLITQPDLSALLNEGVENTYKMGAGVYVSMLASSVNVVVAIATRKLALKKV